MTDERVVELLPMLADPVSLSSAVGDGGAELGDFRQCRNGCLIKCIDSACSNRKHANRLTAFAYRHRSYAANVKQVARVQFIACCVATEMRRIVFEHPLRNTGLALTLGNDAWQRHHDAIHFVMHQC